ncbi:MAG: ABC transporter ATP-binding protein [Pseudomonadota bacterium]
MIAYLKDVLRIVDRRSLVKLLLFSLLITVMEVLSVSAVVPAIGVIVGDSLPVPLVTWLRRAGVESAQMQKVAILAAISAVFFGRGVVLSAVTFAQSRIVFTVQRTLSSTLYRRYLDARFEHVNDLASGVLLRVSTIELNNITHGVVLPIATLVSEAALMAGSVIVLLALQPVVALLLMAVAGVVSLPLVRINRSRLTRLGKTRQTMEADRYQLSQEMIVGAREIKVYGLERQLIDAIDSTNTTYARTLTRITFLQAFPRIYLETMGLCALLIVCALLLLRGRSVGEALTFIMILGLATFRALPSLAKILAQFQSLKFYRPSLNAVLELFDKLLPLAEPMDAGAAPVSPATSRPRGAIHMRLTGAAYRYTSTSSAVFSDLDLRFRTGEVVGFAGASGAGKSTLLDCLIGLRSLSEGTLRVTDDVSGNAIVPAVSYVPQMPVILDASVWRNITLASAEPPGEPVVDERLIEALEISGLGALMASRQLSLVSRIVEGGRNMSGGQRQRLALARALYRDADILVLDESTSALDSEAERGVFAAIKARRADQIILVVTHRVELLSYCTRIIQVGAVPLPGTVQ